MTTTRNHIWATAILSLGILISSLSPASAETSRWRSCPAEKWSDFYYEEFLFSASAAREIVEAAINNAIALRFRDQCIQLCAHTGCYHYHYWHSHPDGTHSTNTGEAQDLARANPGLNLKGEYDPLVLPFLSFIFERVDFHCTCTHICTPCTHPRNESDFKGAGEQCANTAKLEEPTQCDRLTPLPVESVTPEEPS